MKGNFQVRFGERGGETRWLKGQKVRPAPTLRSGSLLLKVGDEAGTPVTLYGQEKDAATSGLARMNMILHNNPTALIMQGNTLTDPKFKDGDTLKTFDLCGREPAVFRQTLEHGPRPAQRSV